MNLTEIYRIFHSLTQSLKYRKTELIPCVLSDHNGLTLHPYNRENPRTHRLMESKQTLLNDEWPYKKELKTFLETNENEHNILR